MRYLALRRDLSSQEVEWIGRSRCLRHETHAVVQTWLRVLLAFIGEMTAQRDVDTCR